MSPAGVTAGGDVDSDLSALPGVDQNNVELDVDGGKK
jgi:hypothetical protein